jgi:hypothetical protein
MRRLLTILADYAQENSRDELFMDIQEINPLSGGAVEAGDIMYQDADVCILRPEVKKGVLVFTHYTQPPGTPLCLAGLKTGEQLRSEGIEFGRSVYHPYIFFRAPYFANPIDYTSVDTEIRSSFGDVENLPSKIWIRVDPEQTFVYSSEIRAERNFRFVPSVVLAEVEKSRKRMSEYFRIIGENASMKVLRGQMALYDMYTSRKSVIASTAEPTKYHRSLRLDRLLLGGYEYPLSPYPIHQQSEVLVRVPHLTPDYFVKCTSP